MCKLVKSGPRLPPFRSTKTYIPYQSNYALRQSSFWDLLLKLEQLIKLAYIARLFFFGCISAPHFMQEFLLLLQNYSLQITDFDIL